MSAPDDVPKSALKRRFRSGRLHTLHKSFDGPGSPFRGETYPRVSLTGIPRAG